MSLALGPVTGSLTAVSESDDAEAGAINAIDDTEWEAPEGKAPIALIERFAHIW
jgi:hypothetical protein